MAAAAARPRWADLVDSSQEDADVVGPLPGLLRRDSWQEKLGRFGISDGFGDDFGMGFLDDF